MKVRATKRCFVGDALRLPGEVFEISQNDPNSGAYFLEKVNDKKEQAPQRPAAPGEK